MTDKEAVDQRLETISFSNGVWTGLPTPHELSANYLRWACELYECNRDPAWRREVETRAAQVMKKIWEDSNSRTVRLCFLYVMRVGEPDSLAVNRYSLGEMAVEVFRVLRDTSGFPKGAFGLSQRNGLEHLETEEDGVCPCPECQIVIHCDSFWRVDLAPIGI